MLFSVVAVAALTFNATPSTVYAAEGNETWSILSNQTSATADVYMLKPDARYSISFKTQLTDDEAFIYDKLVKHYVIEKRNDELVIDLSAKNLKYTEEKDKFIANHLLTCAFDAFKRDYPQAFWIGDAAKSYEILHSSQKIIFIIVRTIQMQSDGNRVDYQRYAGAYNELNTVLNNISPDVSAIKNRRASASRYDTVKAIHDYICEKASYASGYNSDQGEVHSIAPFFGGGKIGYKIVCDGYSHTFKLFCDRLGVPCVHASGFILDEDGKKGAGHAWNYVQMEDEKWYAVDTTWDDKDKIRYNYFLIGKNTICSGGKTFAQNRTLDRSNPNIDLWFPDIADEKYVHNAYEGDTLDFYGKSLENSRIVGSSAAFAWKYTGTQTSTDIFSVYLDDKKIIDSKSYNGTNRMFDDNGIFSTNISFLNVAIAIQKKYKAVDKGGKIEA